MFNYHYISVPTHLDIPSVRSDSSCCSLLVAWSHVDPAMNHNEVISIFSLPSKEVQSKASLRIS
jgi:hypothetical protein